MALNKSTNLAQLCFKKHPILYTAIRNHWNKDYKPGEYPVTAEQREAAAKKYGILPSEYKPFPNDGMGAGDYPDIPLIAGEAKDPYYPYDFPELKRNFQEPLPVEFDMVGEDRYNVTTQLRKPLWRLWAEAFAVIGGSVLFFYATNNIRIMHGVVPKQLPNQGKTHYTFELEE